MDKTKVRILQKGRKLWEDSEVSLEQSDPRIQKILKVASKDVENGRTISLEELDNELGFTDEELNT